MIEDWRAFLYPLGFLPGIAFGIRFFWQWIASEIQKKSVVPKTFWDLSILGNFLAFIHSCIQVQFHLSLIQVANIVISWRHLDLLKHRTEKKSLKTVFCLFGIAFSTTTLLFLTQSALTKDFNWFHVPSTPWNLVDLDSIHSFWHLIGSLSLILFSSRFWIQWWLNEKNNICILGLPFWWISLFGNIACLTYFLRIGDPANFIGPLFNLFPTIRNLMLIYQSKKSTIT